MSAVSRINAVLRSDLVGGSLLIAAAGAALLWANSPLADSYQFLRSWTFGPAAAHLHLSVQAWAADGLLAVFFFVVGNELKQEFVHGQLRDPRRAALPIVAALGGAVMPILVFLAVTAGASGQVRGGWGVPMATDIAFALAVLAVIGRHLPLPVRTFLLTLATVDDLCAVLVIAVAYTGGVDLLALAGAAVGLSLFGYLQNGSGHRVSRMRAAVPGWLLFGPLAAVIWTLMHAGRVHATIAGVAMGLLMRTSPRAGEARSPSHHAEQVLRPFCAGVVLPLFALMSAGVSLFAAPNFWASTITWGVVAGLLAGKFVGIFGTCWLAARFTPAALDPRIAWPDIAGIGLLGGVGFTVSLLVCELSYTGDVQLTDAKGAILLASAAASLSAALVLGHRNRHYLRIRRASTAPAAVHL